MTEVEMGCLICGLSLGLLAGILLAKGVEIYRNKRGWDE